MDADIKSLEEKVSKLISFCASLREENAQLRGDLSKSQHQTTTLKNNMQLATTRLESMLAVLPLEATQILDQESS